jgi:hypothetical protein
MVAMLEIVFLIVFAVLGVWWFRRTNIYRAHRRSGADPGQYGWGASDRFGMLGGANPGPAQRPPHAPEEGSE